MQEQIILIDEGTKLFQIRQQIKDKLSQLSKIKIERSKACSEIETALLELQDELRETAYPFDSQTEILTNEIKNLTDQIKEPLKTANGEVKFRDNGVRTTYDRKALDEIVKDLDETTANKILSCRKETKVKDSISVEVY